MVLGLLQLQFMCFSSYGEQVQWLQCVGFLCGFSSCGSQVSLVAACGLSWPVACGILVL